MLKYPNSAKDAAGRLLCAAAIGVTSDVLDRSAALLDAGADVLVLDSAHGHSANIMRTISLVKERFPDAQLVAGRRGLRQGRHRPRLHLYHARRRGHRRAAGHGGAGVRGDGGPLRRACHCRRRHQVLRRHRQGHRRGRQRRDDGQHARRLRGSAGRDRGISGTSVQGLPRHGQPRRHAVRQQGPLLPAEQQEARSRRRRRPRALPGTRERHHISDDGRPALRHGLHRLARTASSSASPARVSRRATRTISTSPRKPRTTP